MVGNNERGYCFDTNEIIGAAENFIEQREVFIEKSVLCEQIKSAVLHKLSDPDYKERIELYEREQLERGRAGETELRRYADINNEIMRILTSPEVLNNYVGPEEARQLVEQADEIIDTNLRNREQRLILNEMYEYVYAHLSDWIEGIYSATGEDNWRLIFILRKWSNYFCKVEYTEPLTSESIPNAIEIIEIKSWIRNMAHVATLKALLNLTISMRGQIMLSFTTLNILEFSNRFNVPMPVFTKDLQVPKRYINHVKAGLDCLEQLLRETGRDSIFNIIERIFNALFPGAGGVIIFVINFMSCLVDRGIISFTS